MVKKQPTIYTTGQVAKLCAVSIRTVARWIEMNHLKAFRLPGMGSEYRVIKADLLAFMTKFGLPVDHIQDDEGYKIVALDTDNKNLKLMKNLLEELEVEYTYQSFSNTIEGLMNVGLGKPHLVIFDYNMDGLDGSQLYDIFKTEPEWKNTKLIILTTNKNQDLSPLQKTGESFVLKKPLKELDFVKKCTRLLKKVNL